MQEISEFMEKRLITSVFSIDNLKPVASLRLYANNLEFLSSKQEDGNKVEDVGMPMFNLSDINPVASNESHELKVDDIPF